MTTGGHSRNSRGNRHPTVTDVSPANAPISTPSERRADHRYGRDDPVIVTTETGKVFGGVVCNRGLEGLYFESDFLVQCGVRVEIRSANARGPESFQGLKGEIRWTQNLSPREADFRFGAGVLIQRHP
jgi:hypothetical protein